MDRRILPLMIFFVLSLNGFRVQGIADERRENATRIPEVWMSILSADVLVEPGAQWDFVKQHVDGIKLWTQQIDYEVKDWPFQGGVDAPGALEKRCASSTSTAPSATCSACALTKRSLPTSKAARRRSSNT